MIARPRPGLRQRRDRLVRGQRLPAPVPRPARRGVSGGGRATRRRIRAAAGTAPHGPARAISRRRPAPLFTTWITAALAHAGQHLVPLPRAAMPDHVGARLSHR